MSKLLGRPRQTHCKRGHSLAEAYQRPDGQRACRACALAAWKKRWRKDRQFRARHAAASLRRYHQKQAELKALRTAVQNADALRRDVQNHIQVPSAPKASGVAQ